MKSRQRYGPQFNSEYFRLWKEAALLCALNFTNRPYARGNGRILIVNPCLIGEFGASVPALRDFIERNPENTVDLVVTESVRPLAERIIGVGEIFVSRSVYGREQNTSPETLSPPMGYEWIIALRMSPEAFKLIKKTSAKKLTTSFGPFMRYGFHLLLRLILGKTPKQWRTVNFEMLHGRSRELKFEEMFAPTKEDYLVEKRNPPPSENKKIVIIHTGTPWVMKRFPNERWVEALEKIANGDKYKFVFIGTSTDVADYEYISSRLPHASSSMIGKVNLAELMVILRTADYFIGIDSGPATLAHLAETPSVVIFGPGPHMYLPYNERDQILDRSRGRGLSQMFFSSGKGIVGKISALDVVKAFNGLVSGSGHGDSRENVRHNNMA